MVSAPGWTQSRSSRPGPGARSPYRWTSRRNPANASWPVTFCSMTAATRVSKTRWLAPNRRCGLRRQASATSGWGRLESGGVVVGAEHRRDVVEGPGGARDPRPRRGRRRRRVGARRAAWPARGGVRMPRHTSSPCTRNVGSPPPCRCWPRMPRAGHAQSGRHTRRIPSVTCANLRAPVDTSVVEERVLRASRNPGGVVQRRSQGDLLNHRWQPRRRGPPYARRTGSRRGTSPPGRCSPSSRRHRSQPPRPRRTDRAAARRSRSGSVRTGR